MSLFTEYRALGVVSDSNPFHLQKLGNNTFITSSVGRSFHVYDAEHIRLVAVGNPSLHRISALFAVGQNTIASCHNQLALWHRGELRQQRDAFEDGPIDFLLSLPSSDPVQTVKTNLIPREQEEPLPEKNARF